MSADNSYALTVEEVLANQRVDRKVGLSSEEVRRRQQIYGKNEIPSPPGTPLWRLILDQFQDLLVLILLGAAVVSFILACLEEGEDRLAAFVEPAVILIILIANATVGVIQETNAEKAIEKLKESEARHATVIRDGIELTVDASELVPGDIIVLTVGDRVPADCRLLEQNSAVLSVEQAFLTGENEAVDKVVHPIYKENAIVQDKKNMLFSGTLVVRGRGVAVVTTTGGSTEMGRIADDLGKKDDEEDKTPLQQKLDEFGEQLSKIIGVICIIVWVINIGHFTDEKHGSWLRGAIYYFKIAVSLAVAAIPEGLPAVVTTCLALGTIKMSKKNAIVRSLPSVETLGCTTVICSDKTGTLTTNQMSVTAVLTIDQVQKDSVSFKQFNVEGDSFAPFGSIVSAHDSAASVQRGRSTFSPDLQRYNAANEPSLRHVGLICSLCNDASLVYKHDKGADVFSKTGAPTEAALLVLAEKIGITDAAGQEQINKSHNSIRICAARKFWQALFKREVTLEFDRDRKSMSVLVRGENQTLLLCKGAPESILDRCSNIAQSNGDVLPLNDIGRSQIRNALDDYASQGLRCLALAYKPQTEIQDNDLKNPDNYRNIESNMTFVGLVGVMDPPRSNVAESIAKCRTAGIRVVVITGDNKTTAESICRRIGVFAPNEDLRGKSLTGSEFEALSPQEKRRVVQQANLFSRVEPRHKLELVTLLKEQKEVVAMTGDGVNDATALKKADIGVAMGSGTDVAKEASDMVLQDDNFSTIVMAVEEGRAIYNNTKQFIRYLISSNIGEVACIFLTAALGMPEALIPVQLLWVNLVTDGLPATALGFNPPDADVMRRKPRGRTESIINGWTFFRYLVIGVYVGLATVGGFIWWYLYYSQGPQISFSQLTNFHQCSADNPAFQGVDCNIFENESYHRASSVSLSVLVLIEMFNALNALSENQSLLTVPPTSNLYVVLACTLSMILHFAILYIPFLASLFQVTPMNSEEWLYTFYLSFPIIIIDEALKFFSRNMTASKGSVRSKSD